MKKGLKALSAVLALSMGLVGANMVSALSEGAAKYLGATKAESKEAEEVLYESWSTTDAFEKLLDKTNAAIKDFKQDSDVHEMLSTKICEMAEKLESVQNELAAKNKLVKFAETYISGTDAHFETPDPAIQDFPTLAGKASFGGRQDKLNKMIKEYNKLNKAITDKKIKADDKTHSGEFVVNGETYQDKIDALAKEIKAEAAVIASKDYQDAAEVVANYVRGEKGANAHVKNLEKTANNYEAAIRLGLKIFEKNNLTLTACAIPAGLELQKTVAAADKKDAAKKDSLPNTAAAEEVVEAHQFYFPRLVPCACEKKEMKTEEMKPEFTFNQLAADIPVAACPMKKAEAKKADEKPVFSFAQLAKDIEIACCR